MNVNIQCDKCKNVYPGDDILMVNNFGTVELVGAICTSCYNSIGNCEAERCDSDCCEDYCDGQLTIDDFINDNDIEVLTDVDSTY